VIVLLSLDFPAIRNVSLCFGENEEVVITISSPTLQSTDSFKNMNSNNHSKN